MKRNIIMNIECPTSIKEIIRRKYNSCDITLDEYDTYISDIKTNAKSILEWAKQEKKEMISDIEKCKLRKETLIKLIRKLTESKRVNKRKVALLEKDLQQECSNLEDLTKAIPALEYDILDVYRIDI